RRPLWRNSLGHDPGLRVWRMFFYRVVTFWTHAVAVISLGSPGDSCDGIAFCHHRDGFLAQNSKYRSVQFLFHAFSHPAIFVFRCIFPLEGAAIARLAMGG